MRPNRCMSLRHCALAVLTVLADANTVTLVSGPSAVSGGNASVLQSAISGNGRFVVFSSGATNVVGGDTNGTIDVFVHDLQTGSVERVSLSSTGAQITGSSNTVLSPSISADGRFVAWATNAANVVPGATTAVTRVYVRDRQLATTTLVDVAPGGTITDDGKAVVMTSFNALLPADVNGVADAYVKTLATGTLELVSVDSAEAPANAASSNVSISADGRFVTFTSAATNLVGTDTNGTLDLFLRDRLLGTTVRVSVDAAGAQVSSSPFSSAISADGRVVAFTDSLPLIAADLNGTFDIYLRDTGVIAP